MFSLGTFLCIYAAELKDGPTANREGVEYGDEYLADLDYIDVIEDQKEGYEFEVEFSDDDSSKDEATSSSGSSLGPDFIIDSNASSSGSSNGSLDDLTSLDNMIFERPKKKREDFIKIRSYFDEKIPYVLDAKKKGNIGRFMNHSCEPNAFVQTVFVDSHDLRFPWVSFFAGRLVSKFVQVLDFRLNNIFFRNIKAYEEITWDYNYMVGSVEGKKIECKCNSENCRKRLL